MMNAKKIFRDKYINRLSSSPYIGVEIEIPIVNLKKPYLIDEDIIQILFCSLLKKGFNIISEDNKKNIIAIKNNVNGDVISLEYSLNTIEFSLNKELSIDKLESKFFKYYNYICKFLEAYDYKLIESGINPNYNYIDKSCLDEDRYKIIEKLLLTNNQKIFSQFCSYCCSIQTHINVDIDRLVHVLNVFKYIDHIKEEMFSNSYMRETKLKNSRKYLWESSNFGPSNVGENKEFYTISDVIDDYLCRNMFFVQRHNKYLLLKEKISLNDFCNSHALIALDKNNKEVVIRPQRKDIDNFRSYKNVEISKYGTLEIRSDCMQKKDNIFFLIAFNVGIAYSAEEILNYFNKYNKISKKKLLQFAKEGLIKRNKHEERYLKKYEKSWNLDV